jgi:hypothetical protein
MPVYTFSDTSIPFQAILSHMTPRMKPFLAIFANMRKEQQEQEEEQSTPPPPQEIPRRPDPGVIRVLINRGRPMPGTWAACA